MSLWIATFIEDLHIFVGSVVLEALEGVMRGETTAYLRYSLINYNVLQLNILMLSLLVILARRYFLMVNSRGVICGLHLVLADLLLLLDLLLGRHDDTLLV